MTSGIAPSMSSGGIFTVLHNGHRGIGNGCLIGFDVAQIRLMHQVAYSPLLRSEEHLAMLERSMARISGGKALPGVKRDI